MSAATERAVQVIYAAAPVVDDILTALMGDPALLRELADEAEMSEELCLAVDMVNGRDPGEGGLLCSKPKNHKGDHGNGKHTWPQSRPTLVVVAEELVDEARKLFGDLGYRVGGETHIFAPKVHPLHGCVYLEVYGAPYPGQDVSVTFTREWDSQTGTYTTKILSWEKVGT